MSASTTTHETIRIAVVALLLNAGETTRAVEIASAVRDLAKKQGETVDIMFFGSNYSTENCGYDKAAIDAGFQVQHIGPGLTKEQWRIQLEREHEGYEFYTAQEQDHVRDVLLNVKDTLAAYKPTIVLHGFSPNFDGPIASRMLGVPNILFLPLPMSKDFFFTHLLPDVPEEKQTYGVQYVPVFIRRTVFHFMASLPFLPTMGSQPHLRAAAKEAGWVQEGDGMLTDLMAADLVLVNDLPSNYKDVELPANTLVTGPVFPHTDESMVELDPEIKRVFDKNNKRKIFISMGSSGHKEHLLEAIKAVSTGEYNVVAIVPPAICSLDDFKKELGISLPTNIYLTNKFLPAKVVNKMADVAVIHGGQGTVQTAMCSATPIIGTSYQAEQKWNVDCVERHGAGITLTRQAWTQENISKGLETLFSQPSYFEAARKVQKEMEMCDGASLSAAKIIEFAKTKGKTYS